MGRPRRLRADQARRIALAAQGFADPRPRGRVDVRHLRRVLTRIGLLQIDSVNVLARAHYLPLYSRLGAYPAGLLDELAYRRGELFEYWGHEASLLPVDRYPLLRFRMSGMEPGSRTRTLLHEDPGYVEAVLDQVAARGPLAAGELADPGANDGPWWGWSKGKVALEWLFATGRLAVAGRRRFTRLYDLPQRVLPPAVLDARAPDRDEAYRQLLLLASRHHGVGTAGDLADYYRLRRPLARAVLERLADEGLVQHAEVEGWSEPAFLHPEIRLPRRIEARSLLAPFDPVVWERHRTERMFGFRYRIEIYVPADRRTYGYYVLPFLLGDELVARVDLKADRAGGRLVVRGAWGEKTRDRGRVAVALAGELWAIAAWLGLDDVAVAGGGDLAPRLAAAVTSGA